MDLLTQADLQLTTLMNCLLQKSCGPDGVVLPSSRKFFSIILAGEITSAPLLVDKMCTTGWVAWLSGLPHHLQQHFVVTDESVTPPKVCMLNPNSPSNNCLLRKHVARNTPPISLN